MRITENQLRKVVRELAKEQTQHFQLVEDNDISVPQPRIKRRRIPKPDPNGPKNPLDDENNSEVTKGGRWGMVGAGQTPEMFRLRTGIPGLATSNSGKIKPDEINRVVNRVSQVEPDEIVAYSKGAPVYNTARQAGLDSSIPVTYLAPASYRHWGRAPVPPAAPGSKTLIGDKDTIVPYKQAAKNAVEAGTDMYVLPGFSHVGIMYSKAEVTPGAFEVDAEEVINDPEMPDWGRGGSASPEEFIQQQKQVKQHIKSEAALSAFIRSVLSERS